VINPDTALVHQLVHLRAQRFLHTSPNYNHARSAANSRSGSPTRSTTSAQRRPRLSISTTAGAAGNDEDSDDSPTNDSNQVPTTPKLRTASHSTSKHAHELDINADNRILCEPLYFLTLLRVLMEARQQMLMKLSQLVDQWLIKKKDSKKAEGSGESTSKQDRYEAVATLQQQIVGDLREIELLFMELPTDGILAEAIKQFYSKQQNNCTNKSQASSSLSAPFPSSLPKPFGLSAPISSSGRSSAPPPLPVSISPEVPPPPPSDSDSADNKSFSGSPIVENVSSSTIPPPTKARASIGEAGHTRLRSRSKAQNMKKSAGRESMSKSVPFAPAPPEEEEEFEDGEYEDEEDQSNLLNHIQEEDSD
jgi:hypothetical protein